LKKILVTGGNGFVGTTLVPALEKTAEVRKVSLQHQAISDIDFRGVDTVVHLAGIAHRMEETPASLYYDVNRDLTSELANTAKEAGVSHVIFTSTVKVYGLDTSTEVLEITTPCTPNEPYGKSKYEAEQILQGLASEHFRVCILRMPLVYGQGVKGNVLSLMKLVNKMPIIPLGGIDNKRSMISVENLVDYFGVIIEKEFAGIILPSDLKPISTTELLSELAVVLGREIRLISLPRIFVQIIKFVKPAYHKRLFGSLEFSSVESNSKLGFKPKRNPRETFQKMAKSFEDSL